MQQTPHQLRRHSEPAALHLARQVICRLQRPTQQRHRRATRLGPYQLVQRRQQPGLLVDRGSITTARCSLTIRRLDPSPHLPNSLRDRRRTHRRRFNHTSLAATPQRLRHRARNDATLPLVQMRQHRLEEPTQALTRQLHTRTLYLASYPMADPNGWSTEKNRNKFDGTGPTTLGSFCRAEVWM